MPAVAPIPITGVPEPRDPHDASDISRDRVQAHAESAETAQAKKDRQRKFM